MNDENEIVAAEKLLAASEKVLDMCGPVGKKLFKMFSKCSMDDVDVLNDKVSMPAISQGIVFVADITAKVTVKMKEEGFRAKVVTGGAEYFLKGLYLTAGNKLIVQMTPVDDQPWEWIELGVSQADKLFPSLGAELLKAHKIVGAQENLIECIHEIVKMEQSGEKQEVQKLAEDPSFGLF